VPQIPGAPTIFDVQAAAAVGTGPAGTSAGAHRLRSVIDRRNIMKRVLTTTIAALLAAGASSVAFAQTTSPTPSTPTTQPTPATPPTDTSTTAQDNHGSTVREAAQHDTTGKPSTPPGQDVRETAHLQRDFMKLDADKNGSLSQTELSSDVELTGNFSTLDENGDGILSRDEFNGHLDLDADTDIDDTVEDEE
jgi:hypothetical protein